MDSLRQIGTGIVLAIASIVIILGGFALASAEGRKAADVAPANEVVFTNTAEITSTPPASETPAPNVITATSTAQPTETTTALPSPTVITLTATQPVTALCPPPTGWIAIIVEPNNTLVSIAQAYDMTVDAIKQGNCLTSDLLQAGSILYVMPLPTATIYPATYVPCGAPFGWVDYYVVAGDTLYNLSARYRVTVTELQRANCLGNSTNIRVGQKIKVPFYATPEPLPTLSPTPTEYILPTEIIPTETETPIPTVEIPTLTIEPSPTEIPPTPVTPIVIQEASTPTPFAGFR